MKRTLFLLNLLLFSVSASIEAASFSVAPTNIGVGQTRQLSIVMSNSETNLGGFQMRLTLPQGISVKKNESGRFIYSVSERIADHTISFTQMSDGSYQILCYSMNADVISGTSGEMLSISVTADDSFVSSSTGSLTNIKVTNTSAVVNSCDDVNFPLNWVIAFADENVKAICVDNWDTNGDGELSEAEAAAVTDLGEVFRGNTEITSFDELKYFTGLTSIGLNAFSQSGIVTINLPEGLTTIGDAAFVNCNFASISIPASVTSIGGGAFFACHNLETISVADGNTVYDSRDNCNAIIETGSNTLLWGCKSTVIPSTVKVINSIAFEELNISSVNLPEGLESIKNNAFKHCHELPSVTLPSTLTCIESEAFLGCSHLAAVVSEIETPFAFGTDAFNDIGSSCVLTVPYGTRDAYIAAGWTEDVFKGGIVENISFADANVKALCVANWDANGDGELSEAEAAAVTDLGETFKGNTGITSFDELQYFTGLTVIGESAFEGCTNLASIILPQGLTWIRGNAFKNCTALTSIDLPVDLKDIGYFAFEQSGLTSLVIPEGMDIIQTNAFWKCANLVEVTWPADLTTINPYMFSNCTALETVTIPEGVTIIGEGAFRDCGSLTSVILPSSLTTIENSAFRESGLTSIEVPVGVKTIGYYAFNDCKNLTSVVLPEGITTFNNAVFAGCNNLTNVNWPSDLTTISPWTFSSCAFTSFTIPETVTEIGDHAFYNCNGLTEIIIPASVTSIGHNAFYGCNNLKRINDWTTTSTDYFHFNTWSTEEDGSGITTPFIELWRGAGNMLNDATITHDPITGLTPGLYTVKILARAYNEGDSTTYPSGVTFFANNASVKLSDVCMRSVYNSEFVGQSALLYGELSLDCTVGQDGVLNLGFQIEDAVGDWLAFKNLDFELKVKNIVFADANVKALCVANWDTNGDGELSEAEAAAVTDLGTVFKGNKTIQTFDELQYFTGLTSIAGEAFRDCTNLTSVIIPASNITEIKYEAFMGCSFSSITLSEGLTRIGDRAFANNPALTSVVIPSTVTDIFQGAFMNCVALTSITLPDGLKTLTLSSLRNTSITSITLPSSLEKIEHNALDYCKQLTAITIPENVTTIEECAFANCSSLSSVVSLVQSPATIVKNVFMSIGPDCVLTIPQVTCYEDYVAKGWTPELFARIEPSYIIFADNAVKAICLQNWDADHDGMLTFAEAAAVTDLGNVFVGNTQIVTFNELKYFTGLSTLSADAFRGCSALTSITVPADLPSYGTLSFKGCTILAEINIGTDRNVHNLGFVNRAQGWSDEGTVDCFCSEFWNKAFDTHQTLLVPNGSYRMKFKAFQRPADYTTAYNDYAAGNWDSFAVVYANDTQKALKHICDGMQEQRLDGSDVAVGNSYIPNNMWSARVYFDAGLYADELEVEVTDGTLTFGVRGDYKQYSQWAIFSDFELSLKKVLATGIALNSESVTMTGTGETYSLYATVSPTAVTEKSVTWTSSDESVATVSNDGVVTAIANGTAIITATTNDGSNLSAACTVTVDIPAVEPDTDISGLDNVIYIEAQSVYVGDEVTLDVKMKNTLIPVGCSFRLTLPSGFTLKRDEYDDVDYILGSRANKMSVNLSETSDASYNVALTPTSGTATIRGNEDTVVSFTLQVSDEAVAGTYPVRLTRSLIQSKVDGTTYDTSLSDVYVTFTVEDCLLGDVNGDGNITPSDAIMILYHYFEVGQNGFNVKAADVNGDGSITPADAIEVLYIYFNDSSGSKSRQTDFQELDPQ